MQTFLTGDVVDRRSFLRTASAALSLGLAPLIEVVSSEPRDRSSMGLVAYCCRLRQELLKPAEDLLTPKRFLQHCQEVGAGGMQIHLGALEAADARSLRNTAEQNGLYLEAIIDVPKDDAELGRFEAEVKAAVEAGALAARTVIIPGRRYEYFDNLETYREFSARGRAALERAAPIVERHRLPLAVENHKDHLIGERISLFEHLSSEYIGACVDTGNSFALLEDPLETVRALAPWALSVHLKDQAVRSYDEGFLLADIPLGQGCLDLKSMVRILKQQRPNVKFSLELITRDPLQVPCLTSKYWATFPDLPGAHLARTLETVRACAAESLQELGGLELKDKVELEDANVRQSLDYARDQLGLSWSS